MKIDNRLIFMLLEDIEKEQTSPEISEKYDTETIEAHKGYIVASALAISMGYADGAPICLQPNELTQKGRDYLEKHRDTI